MEDLTKTEQLNMEKAAKAEMTKTPAPKQLKRKKGIAVKKDDIQKEITNLEEMATKGDAMLSERQTAIKTLQEEINSISVQLLQVKAAIDAYKKLM